MSAQPQWSPVDESTADLLSTLAADGSPIRSREEEWAAFVAALRHVAKWNGGVVDQNDMRVHTRSLNPRRVGPWYRRACLEGLIRAEGWSVSDDVAGKNAGRPQKRYVWVGGAA